MHAVNNFAQREDWEERERERKIKVRRTSCLVEKDVRYFRPDPGSRIHIGIPTIWKQWPSQQGLYSQLNLEQLMSSSCIQMGLPTASIVDGSFLRRRVDIDRTGCSTPAYEDLAELSSLLRLSTATGGQILAGTTAEKKAVKRKTTGTTTIFFLYNSSSSSSN